MKPKVITVYLDESGDFDVIAGAPKREPWVVGGFYIESDNRSASAKLQSCLKELADNVTSSPWYLPLYEAANQEILHNLELEAPKQRLLQEFVDLPGSSLLLHRASLIEAFLRYRPALLETALPSLDTAVYDLLKSVSIRTAPLAIVHSGRKTNHSASNYAVLVLELVFRICTRLSSIYTGSESPELRFVVARRRREDHQDWIHDMNADQLSIAVANGLASAGALRFLPPTGGSVKVVPAETSPALVIADFVCGHCRNIVSQVGFDAACGKLDRLEISLYQLETSPTRKKASLAESSRDYVEALFALLHESPHDDVRLFQTLNRWIKESSEMQFRFDVESLINKLDHWSETTDTKTFTAALLSLCEKFDEVLEEAMGVQSVPPTIEAARFRLRAYLLHWVNHIGDSKLASDLNRLLEDVKGKIVGDPLIAEAVFQHEVGMIEQAINDHRFFESESLASAHIANLRLFASIEDQPGKSRPHHAVTRGKSIELRASALSAAFANDHEKLSLVAELVEEECIGLVPSTGLAIASANDDMIRLLQIQAFCGEVLGSYEALRENLVRLLQILDSSQRVMPYGVALLARIVASTSLMKRNSFDFDDKLTHHLKAGIDIALREGFEHPYEILSREWLIWLHCTGNAVDENRQTVREALASWERSTETTSEVLRHQVRLSKLVGKFERGLAIQESLTESEAQKVAHYRKCGIGSHECQLLAVRACTIY